MKGFLQKLIGKQSATNAARDAAERAEPIGAQTLAAEKMTTLTEKDLEGVQGGGDGYFLKIDSTN